jgi:hypothetical protein
MDMSKLPRLSQSAGAPGSPAQQPAAPENATLAPQPTAPAPADAAPVAMAEYHAQPPLPVLAEAWISLAIGAILLLANPHLLQWLISLVSSYHPSFLPITDLGTGNVVPYSSSVFFFNDLCMFSFAIALLLDGVLLLSRVRALVILGLIVMLIATAMNAIYLAQSSLNGAGLALMSAIAVAIGVYLAISQWRLLAMLRGIRRDNPAVRA